MAQLRIGLVREASLEKRVIQQIAPHLAYPMAFTYPVFESTRWPGWMLKFGVWFYDFLCGGRNLGRSHTLDLEQTVTHLPPLTRDGLKGSLIFYDGQTNDARLVIDTLRSAARHGGRGINYVRFGKAERDGDEWRCDLTDGLTEGAHVVRARCVVNAAGPWADQFPQSAVKLRLTKGIHLVVERARVPIQEAVVMQDGRRIMFAIPWGKRLILGTTDTDYDGSIEDVHAEPEEVESVLKVTNRMFPDAALTPQDVLSTWAGLRPLIGNRKGGPSDTSRAHQIRMPEPDWFDVAGGKLTTYRVMAEQTVDRIVRRLRRAAKPCRTAEEPLVEPTDAEGISGIVPGEATKEAVRHYCEEEWPVRLEDVMLRRGGWHHYCPDAGEIAERVADWMAESLGWDEGRKAGELESYRRALAASQLAAEPSAAS